MNQLNGQRPAFFMMRRPASSMDVTEPDPIEFGSQRAKPVLVACPPVPEPGLSTPPLYFGEVRLHDLKESKRTGEMNLYFGLLDCSPLGAHPFVGLFVGKQSGQRLKIWLRTPRHGIQCRNRHPSGRSAIDALGSRQRQRFSRETVAG